MSKLLRQNKPFRVFVLFQVFSGVGTGLFGLFMMWAVHAMYQNTLYTGIAGFMFAFPHVAGFLIGPIIDRRNKALIMRAASFVQVVAIGLLLALPLLYELNIWIIQLIILAFSAAGMLNGPSGIALLPKIVTDGDDLMKANAVIRMAMVFAGLGVGALLYVLMQQEAPFEAIYAINIGVMLLALASSAFMRDPDAKPNRAKAAVGTYMTELKAGFVFVKKGIMLHLLIVMLALNLFAEAAFVNMPMFAEIHTGTASAYIIIMALAMVGTLIGSYVSSILGPRLKIWKILSVAFILMGTARFAFVFILPDNFTRALLVHAVYAGMAGTIGIIYQTLMQRLMPPQIMARATAIRISIYSVASAVGALIGGFAGTVLPRLELVFMIQAGGYIAIGLCVAASARVRGLPKIGEVTTME